MTTSTSTSTFDEYIQENNLQSKEHQKVGVAWCLSKEISGTTFEDKSHIKGGIIADEMGLGKTIQMVGTIVSNNLTNTLIILPVALIEQWKSFIEKTSKTQVLVYHGTKRETKSEFLKTFPIVISTYGILARSRNSPLHEITWDRLVFDEAHHLRNQKNKIFKGALALKANIRWLITGTPIQNSIKDFNSLCQQLGLNKSFYKNPDNIKIIAKSLLLKRTKSEVKIQLPPLKIFTTRIPWASKAEQELAEEIHCMLEFSNIAPNTKQYHIGPAFGNKKLPLLIRARQACVYPPLLKDKVADLVKDFDPIFNPGLKEMLEEATNPLIAPASKINGIVKQILKNSQNRETFKRKLIFCHYRKEIDIIKEKLEGASQMQDQSQIPLKVEIFDGRIKQDERNEILASKDVDVLILQIQTGCEGLNLQHFNEIYFVSPHWNPAVEDQAIARAHRIGQNKEVHVYRFQMGDFDEAGTQHTIEDYVEKVQKRKRLTLKLITSQ
jgi:SNF2 family DNA or RNA helicase